MNRLQTRQRHGRRELIAVILLVVPLVALGYYLAAIEVAVDPPPDPVSGSTPTIVATPSATPGNTPGETGTPSPRNAPATPRPGASRVLPSGEDNAMAMLHVTTRAA